MPESELPVIPPERGDDLHNLEAAETADLVLFMAGNQFMVMDDLVGAFRQTSSGNREQYFTRRCRPAWSSSRSLPAGRCSRIASCG